MGSVSSRVWSSPYPCQNNQDESNYLVSICPSHLQWPIIICQLDSIKKHLELSKPPFWVYVWGVSRGDWYVGQQTEGEDPPWLWVAPYNRHIAWVRQKAKKGRLLCVCRAPFSWEIRLLLLSPLDIRLCFFSLSTLIHNSLSRGSWALVSVWCCLKPFCSRASSFLVCMVIDVYWSQVCRWPVDSTPRSLIL